MSKVIGRGVMAALVISFAGGALAQPVQQQSPASIEVRQDDEIALYGRKSIGSPASEVWTQSRETGANVRNVTRPTLTPFLPSPDRASGAAVIVLPGGGFMGLSIDKEGREVARALAQRGIAAFVLKYRLVATPPDEGEARTFMAGEMRQAIKNGFADLSARSKAPEDGKAAVAFVRANAAKWGVDAKRVGVMGFSAGAMTSLSIALDADASARPAFVGYVYGPQDSVSIPADAPPLFDAIALNDPLFRWNGFGIAAAWQAAKRPVEIHGYQKGGHGFGIGSPNTSNALLIDEFVSWLSMQGWLGRQQSM